jgi:hypothetical protein
MRNERGRQRIGFGACLLGVSLWAACSAPYPDGKLACSSDDDCPSGFTCYARAGTAAELFCFQGAQPEQSRSPSTGKPEPDAAVSGEDPSAFEDVASGVAGSIAAPAHTAGTGGAGAGRGGNAAAEGGAHARMSAGSTAGAQAGHSGQAGDTGHAEAGQAGAAGRASSGGAGGMSDAGNGTRCGPAPECEPGTAESVMLPCGACGSGRDRGTRSCGEDCRWSVPVPSGTCMNVTGACEPGDRSSESRACECGRMQTRAKTCSDSCEWIADAWGACDLTGVECKPGDQTTESRGCECGRMQSRAKTCSDSCHWDTADWGACDLAGVECKPGDSQMQTVPCASCGTRTQQRSCAADSCKWSGWSDVSAACASACEDCAEVQFCMAPSGQPNPGGTKCRQMLKACTREQALADCNADIPVVCGKVSQPFFMQYL